MILFLAVIIDFLIGDPVYPYHPIRIMGRIIRCEEKFVRAYSDSNRELFWGGLFMLLFNLAIASGVVNLVLFFSNRILYTIISVYLIYSSIAARDLIKSANRVKLALHGPIDEARHALSMIVGRDTTKLNREEIVRATVETVAENTSDGIIAPLFYIFLLGPAGGMMYKFVNTMDSTIGYRDERYEYLGKAAAIFDDVVNFIPARITGLLFVAGAFILGYDYKNAFDIMIRDASKHASPNAGYPEAAVAGMLNVRLGGPSTYHGVMEQKAYLGDDNRTIEMEDITRANRIAILSEIIFVLCIIIIKIFWRLK